jgi:hypothetical protein
MGTAINGTKVSNFYINGSKVNGFAKNGEIVFKREGDTVAPAYNSLGIVRNNNAGETRDTHYAKIGDSVRVLIYFSEQLAVEPKVKIANKEYTATYRPLSSSNGLFAYYADCDLTEDLIAGHRYYGRVTFRGSEDTMYQWQQQLNSPNLTQSYGENSPNEVTISTIFAEITTQYRLFYNMTATFANAESKAYLKEPMLVDVTDMLASGLTEEQIKTQLDGMQFFADTTPPEYVQIQVYNKNNTSSTTITNGETVRILATFNTELGTLPTLTIGKQKILMKATSDGKGGIIYQADITIASDNIMEEGVLKFTISGYTDKNGNEGEKVTEANARNSLTYYV